jgi:hypothetical protein
MTEQEYNEPEITPRGLGDVDADAARVAPVLFTADPWSKPEHVPLTCWLRIKGRSTAWLILAVDPLGVGIFPNGQAKWTWIDLREAEYSTDRRTWKPCVVEHSADPTP